MAKRIIQMGLISSHSTYDSDVLELSNAEFDVSVRQGVTEMKGQRWPLELELNLVIREKMDVSEKESMETAFEVTMRYRLELDDNEITTDALKKDVYAATWPYCRKDINAMFFFVPAAFATFAVLHWIRFHQTV